MYKEKFEMTYIATQMERILLPLREIIAGYAAEFEFVDFDPQFKRFMPLDVLHKRPDFMKLLRENPNRVIHGGFRDVDHGEDAGDDRWMVEPLEDHKWSVLPEMPSLEQIRQISEYNICICATAGGYALLQKNPARAILIHIHIFKNDPSCEIDLLVLSDRDDTSDIDVNQILRGVDGATVQIYDGRYAVKFIPVVSDDVKRALNV